MINQAAFLQEMDATLASAFADAGMADAATYLPASGYGTAAACTVLVDRALRSIGEGGLASPGGVVAVTLFLAEIAAPEQGGLVTLTGTGERLRLVVLDLADESQQRWVVEPA